MSVLIEVIITTFFSVLISTEEVKTNISENIDMQEEYTVIVSERCE